MSNYVYASGQAAVQGSQDLGPARLLASDLTLMARGTLLGQTGIVVSPDESAVYCVSGGKTYSLDPLTLAVISVNATPSGLGLSLNWPRKKLYTSDGQGNYAVIDALTMQTVYSSGAQSILYTPQNSIGVSSDGSVVALYQNLSRLSGSLIVINPDTGLVTKTINGLGSYLTSGVTLNRAGTIAYVVRGLIYRVDLSTGTIISTGTYNAAEELLLSIDETSLYLTRDGGDSIYTYNAQNLGYISAKYIGLDTDGFTYDSTGTYIYSGHQPSSGALEVVSKIRVSDLSVASTSTGLFNSLEGVTSAPGVIPVYGCTVLGASNYNPLATSNDGSCLFSAGPATPVIGGGGGGAVIGVGANGDGSGLGGRGSGGNGAGGGCFNNIFWLASPGATTYNVYRASDINSSFLNIANAITNLYFKDYTTSSDNGVVYYYKIQSVNSMGVSVLSSAFSVITSCPVSPNQTCDCGSFFYSSLSIDAATSLPQPCESYELLDLPEPPNTCVVFTVNC